VGYDFTFSPGGKSVSILYNMTNDERILNAFRDSVAETMNDIESEVQARVRKSGKNEDRRVGNLIWGEFTHLTGRPLGDGIPDCQLHTHCFALNIMRDSEERVWKAGQFRELKRDAPYFEALFQARFARRLAELGLPIERTRTGFEIKGISRELIEKFSRRTAVIETVAKRKGIADPAAKAKLGAKTRNNKATDLTMAELRSKWRSQMSNDEWNTIDRLNKQVGGKTVPIHPLAAVHAMKYAVDKEFERRSVLPLRTVLATALKHAVGLASPDQVLRQADRDGLALFDLNRGSC
jgi:conjugative relaxase-like TrwC/TraI family protein